MLNWGICLIGQEADITFTGNFQDVEFLDFVEEVESQTGVSFYFMEKWVGGIRVTASGAEISLKRTLDKALLPAGLSYVMINKNQVYITDQVPFVTTLPSYKEGSVKMDAVEADEKTGLTSTELKYIDGRKAGILETIMVWISLFDFV